MASGPLLVLIAGIDRSGTGDDPEPIAANAGGALAGADEMVRLAREPAAAVDRDPAETPGVGG